MTINLHLPPKSDMLRPTITVFGVGGAGGNAVNNMISSSLEGVNFVVANTDAQALDATMAERTIQLGASLTKGLGAGATPEVGRAAAEEAVDEIVSHLDGSNMVFITAGMGGGTGTGAAPVIARLAKERGILTVGVVTKPFHFEGAHRMRLAEKGLSEMQSYVDTLIVIPNQNLFRIANEKTTFSEAFRMADEVLHSGVRGVTDLMVMPGLINLDFADIRTVMREMGKAMMGTGEATGDRRAIDAAEAAISNPLLDDVSMKGAKGVLINITGGKDMTLFEVDEAANRIREEVDPDANIIFGSAFNDGLEGKIRVSVVATGIESQMQTNTTNGGITRAGVPVQPDVRKYFPALGVPRVEPVKVPVAPVAVKTPFESQREKSLEQKFAEQRHEVPVAAAAPVAAVRPALAPEPVVARAPSVEPMAPMMIARDYDQKRFDFSQQTVNVSTPADADMSLSAAPKVEPVVIPVIEAQEQQQVQEQQIHAQLQAQMPQQMAAGAEMMASPQRTEVRETQEAIGSLSFFQKMAGMGRALGGSRPQAEQPRRAVVVSERKQLEPVAAGPVQQQEDQQLEIPAFLRRQAN